MEKPFSSACERNQDPILKVLEHELSMTPWVLEVGSGTGQHAVYFTQHLRHLIWQTSEHKDNMAGLHMWLKEAATPQLPHPIDLDVNEPHWREKVPTPAPAVFTSNTFHILSWEEVQLFFSHLDDVLEDKGKLIVYGPFNYNKAYTSPSNAQFDQYLRAKNPLSGIRDFEEVNLLAEAHGLSLLRDYSMPANNHILVWLKSA